MDLAPPMASIHLYTMQFGDGSSLYGELNKSLRDENRGSLIPWFLFLKLFFTALHKLPSQNGTIWRGIRDVDLSFKYQKGTKLAWWGVSSCTTNVEILKSSQFLGRIGLRTMFSIECLHGKSVAKHSYYAGSEQEIILMPGSYFEVEGQLSPAPDLYIIHLKEIIPPIVLVKLPFSKMVTLNTNTPSLSNWTTTTQNDANKNSLEISVDQSMRHKLQWSQIGVTVAGGNGKGNATNQLWNPCGLAIDDNQTLIIADYWNNRIIEWRKHARSGTILIGGKNEETGLNRLYHPTAVLIDDVTNSLIICDRGNRRVIQWSRLGNTHEEILFDDIRCSGIAMDRRRYLYVSDMDKHEVRRYKMGHKKGVCVAGGNSAGSNLNQLNEPMYVFVDQARNLYIADNKNHRVVKWNKGAKEGILVAGGDGQGNGLTQLAYPQGVFVDDSGTLYVADTGNERIMSWTPDAKQGTMISGKNGRGAEANQFHWPWSLSFDRYKNLYVVDNQNHRVQRLNLIEL